MSKWFFKSRWDENYFEDIMSKKMMTETRTEPWTLQDWWVM